MGHQPDNLGKLVARVVNFSGSRYVNIPRPILHHLAWNDGDVVKVEIQGERLVMTRVPLEKLGKDSISNLEQRPPAATLHNVPDTE